jgi:CheY-like chemotaxis protein
MSPEVLLVDDDALIVASLATYLEDEGMAVARAGSGEEAVALVAAGARFQVCIMDIRLPGMDGSEAILALRAIDPDLRFLIHTGSSNYTLSPPLLALGLTTRQLFHKPVADMAQVAAALRELTAGTETLAP